jgi:hypothetical protein
MRLVVAALLIAVVVGAAGCGGSGSDQWNSAMDSIISENTGFIDDTVAFEEQLDTKAPTGIIVATINRQHRRLARMQVQAEDLPASTANQRQTAHLLARAFASYRSAYDHYLVGVRRHDELAMVRGDRAEARGHLLFGRVRQLVDSGESSGGVEKDLHMVAAEASPLSAIAVRFGDKLFVDLKAPNAKNATLRADALAARDAFRRAAAAYASFNGVKDARLASAVASYARGSTLLAQAYDDYYRGFSGGGRQLLFRGDRLKSRGAAAFDRGSEQVKKLADDLLGN